MALSKAAFRLAPDGKQLVLKDLQQLYRGAALCLFLLLARHPYSNKPQRSPNPGGVRLPYIRHSGLLSKVPLSLPLPSESTSEPEQLAVTVPASRVRAQGQAPTRTVGVVFEGVTITVE